MRPTEQKVTLQVLWQSEDSIRVTPFKEGSVVESTIKTSRTCHFHSGMVAERARDVLALLARANGGEENLLDELIEAGRAIWVDLLPDFLKEKFAEAHGRNLVLHLDRQLLGIPWELLHDGDDFLGRRFRMGRLVTVEDDRRGGLQRAMSSPLSVLIVADPCGDLPAARREAAEIEETIEAWQSVGPVTILAGDVSMRTFRDELGRHDVLHYAGHADFDEVTGESALRLSDGLFSVRLLSQLAGRVDMPGLVFLNACGSAEESRQLVTRHALMGRSGGLASAFLLAGVRHVVATLWELRDEVARLFAVPFYRDLGAGTPIGGAMQSGREAVLGRFGVERLLWADHLLYGDPTWEVDTGSNLTFDDFDVLDSLEQKHRTELLSDDGPTRLRAAAMLLRLGDRSAVVALRRDLELLAVWLEPGATRQETRQARFVIHALAAAAGLSPADRPEELPDLAAVKLLLERLPRA
ncbi:MAG: hypothetical protein ACI9EF_000944 [Pseudohongiellaceae bacterium]|jgi:hypothetical protein